MGEIADMMINGFLCEQCGCWLDGEESGYARLCAGCVADDPHEPRNLAAFAFRCRCGRGFASPDARDQHARDKLKLKPKSTRHGRPEADR